MAYNEKITNRLREAFAEALEHDKRKLVEKKMFRGVTFMVDGKMAASAGDDRFMFRIDPALHETVMESEGVTPVIMRGRSYKGYVRVQEDAVKTKRELNKWIAMTLEFNKQAKASPKKKAAKKK
ncbi:MAG TPA: TfoX/Sxy family protein [Candidatus Kapabacteria bacterium]|jgi:TfoX/Sxy family transcriptional regulator of competence genes